MADPVWLPVEELEYDPRYYPRLEVDLACTVVRYRQLLERDPDFEFPPVTVVRRPVGGFLIIDGVHRQLAYLRAGRTHLWAVVEAIPQSLWFERAVELNVGHGRPIGVGDRRKIIDRLRADGYRLDKIAGIIRIGAAELERIVSVERDVRPHLPTTAQVPTPITRRAGLTPPPAAPTPPPSPDPMPREARLPAATPGRPRQARRYLHPDALPEAPAEEPAPLDEKAQQIQALDAAIVTLGSPRLLVEDADVAGRVRELAFLALDAEERTHRQPA